jgi:predicted PurR-regulated permease PerM
MSAEKQAVFWFAGLALFIWLLYVLSGVLLPFVAGMVIAYFLDPLADWLEAKRLPRALAAGLILAAFFVAVVLLLVVLFPLLQAQIVGLISRVPDLVVLLREQAAPVLERLQANLSAEDMDRLRNAAGDFAGKAVQIVGGLVQRLWSGGMAVLHVLSLMIITPLVAFYLLNDWDHLVTKVDNLLPRQHAQTIRDQVSEIDRTIAGFLRGQATVCLILGTFYGLGLTIVGLDFGLLVGVGTGLISFIPYFGMTVGLITAMGIALAQYSDVAPIVMVAAVFAVGQVAEGNFLTPKLVGGRIGLHPVWIIFALLAGGSMFGFTGILLAVPVSAVVGVVIRFLVGRYTDSSLYGNPEEGPEEGEKAPAPDNGDHPS